MKRYLEEKLSPEKALKKRWKIAFNFSLFSIHTLDEYHKASAKRRANQIITEQIFVVTNFVLEVTSAVFDQLSSRHKTHYIFAAMLISFATLLICIGELVYRGRKARVAWKWRNKIPPLYYPSSGQKPFGSVTDIFGLVCAILQCIFNAIAYVLYRRGINNPIQLVIMPPVFAFCVMCSKILKKNCEEDNASTEIPHPRMA